MSLEEIFSAISFSGDNIFLFRGITIVDIRLIKRDVLKGRLRTELS